MARQELYINNLSADLGEGVSAPLNFQIADIKEPTKRNSHFSKTIKLPGTKRNNQIFTNIFEVSKEVLSDDLSINYNPDFNPNLKAEAIFFVDHFVQFKGFVRLRSIEIQNWGDDYALVYNVELYGNLADIFQDLGKTTIPELDFSEYDHDYIKANQELSWDTSIIKDGAPFVNFAGAPEPGFTNGPPTGEGYTYPLINYGWTPLTSYKVDRLWPAVYVKTIVDKIFSFTGFTYSSSFFDSAFFKKLVAPFDGGFVDLTPAQITERLFRAELTATINETTDIEYTVPTGFPPDGGNHEGSKETTVVFDDDSTGANFDNGNNYDTVLGTYTVPANGKYKFQTTADMSWTINPPAGTGFTQGFLQVQLVIVNQTTGLVIGGAALSSGTSSSNTLTAITGTNSLSVGEEIIVRATVTSTSLKFRTGILGAVLTDPATIDWTVDAGATFENEVVNALTFEGDTMQINSVVPDMPAKDWFVGLIRQFNLYVDVDPTDERNLIIEPLVDFYAGNQTIDMTKKLDTNRPITVKTVAEIDAREWIFTYKEDKDFDNVRWQDSHEGNVYGHFTKTIKNDFVKKEKRFELPFGAPVMVGNLSNDLVVMRVAKEDPVGSGTLTPLEGLPRILHYSGLLDAGGVWIYQSTLGPNTPETEYPYAGHLDHPETPTVDLLFGTPDEVYFGTPAGIGANYTDNNLYNKYYSQFIEEVTSKDSKLVEAYFDLTPKDIYDLNFADFWYVDGAVYRLNKVVDYDSISGESTKVELSKLITGTPFVPNPVGTLDLRGTSNAGKIDGSIDSVRTPGPLTEYTKIDGGEDEVLSLKQTGNIRIIDGGQLS